MFITENKEFAMESKEISEVHFYQGVKFGGSVIRFVILDSAYSDATLRRGNKAKLHDGVGVTVVNENSGEEITVPFNNISYIKFVKTQGNVRKIK